VEMRLPTHSIIKNDVDPLQILFDEKTRNDGTDAGSSPQNKLSPGHEERIFNLASPFYHRVCNLSSCAGFRSSRVTNLVLRGTEKEEQFRF
jgi:hypothetical protein